MKIVYIFIYFLFVESNTIAQELSFAKDKVSVVYSYAEQMPVAGYDFEKYITDHLSFTPSDVARHVEGKLYVQFVVQKNGRLRDIEVIRGENKVIDSAVKNIIGRATPWIPAQQGKKKVDCRVTRRIIYKAG